MHGNRISCYASFNEMTYQLQELSVFVASSNTERLFMLGEQDRIYVEVSMFYFKPYSHILLTAIK